MKHKTTMGMTITMQFECMSPHSRSYIADDDDDGVELPIMVMPPNSISQPTELFSRLLPRRCHLSSSGRKTS